MAIDPRRGRAWLALAALLLLVACGAEGYQREGWGGGYSEERVHHRVWRIAYRSTAINHETLQAYWL